MRAMARAARPLLLLAILAYLICLYPSHAIRTDVLRNQITAASSSIIKPTFAGYIEVDKDGSSIYYAYYEAQARSEDVGEAPILLWLQGGPGCASTFGGFYELGPWSVTSELRVQRNPGAWNRIFGLLLMDQPVGSGYSRAASGSASIPTDEMGMAAHLYSGLQGFFTQHHALAARPLFITGESYAGKYVPSIAHYILQAQQETATAAAATATAAANSEATASAVERTAVAGTVSAATKLTTPGRTLTADATTATVTATAGEATTTTTATTITTTTATSATAAPPLRFRRPLPVGTSAPAFRLAGVAIGNGLTDPRAQTQTLAAAAYYSGLLPPALRDEVAGRAAEVVALIDEGKWLEAHERREALRSFITNVTGLGTMFDTRRTEEYDPTKAVDRFLNLPEVKEAMRADPAVQYVSCSDAVRTAMAADVMRSVKHLIPDVLAHIPVLLYQGQYDILDGVASVTSWLNSLEWTDKAKFASQRGQLWRLAGGEEEGAAGDAAWRTNSRGGGGGGGGEVAGWRRSAGGLTQVVVYRAGHMVPHDQPAAAQQMMEGWVLGALEGRN